MPRFSYESPAMSRLDEQSLGRLVSAVFDADEAEGESLLATLDFAQSKTAFENLTRIIGALDPGPQAEACADLLLETTSESADPDMALANWERLFAAYFSHAGLTSLLLSDPQLVEHLSRLFGHSQFLADILVRSPEYIEWLELPEGQDEKPLATYIREMTDVAAIFHERESQREALCRYHRRELLRIGLRDLMEWASLETVTIELSDLAQAMVQTALALCSEHLQRRFGSPLCGEGPAPCGFAVIAMGKLGGRELNYSSDIDLIFIYEAPGVTSGVEDSTGYRTGAISNQEYFAKLGADLIDFLSRHGSEGHLYRVDMRLRPEGTSGALAHSFAACQNYYLRRARLWERIALLKARGIAGSPGLIGQFEDLATGFVFAPTTPATLLHEVASLKERIDRSVSNSDLAEREIKRGRGGIREIEFIVAALEIIYGENRPTVRQRSTLAAIEALASESILTPEEIRLLDSAYRFFRRIEHALQCMAWRQTHVLPTDEIEQAALAARCGIHGASRAETVARFAGERRRLAEAVHEMFHEMFHGAVEKEPIEAASPLRLLDGDCSADEATALLTRWRLRDPAIVESVRRLARGSPTLYISAEGQRRFEKLLPAFLESCSHAPWPENAIRHFETFAQTCGDASSYYTLWEENRSFLDLLIRLFGASGHLTQQLLGNFGWFEPLIAPETFEAAPRWLHQTGRDLASSCAREPSDRLRALRDFALFGSLRIGVRYILGLTTSAEMARALSSLADTCVEAATLWASEEIILKNGGPAAETAPFTVLALGKLGHRELTFFSDLDLVFISDTSGPWAARTAPDGDTALAHIAERLIFYLTEPAAGGSPFRVDARLRPEGSGSPLVTSLERFRRHFERTSEVWEIQTYLGARTIAGDRPIGERALAIVASAMRGLGANEKIAEAVRLMRERLEATVVLPEWAMADFKRGRGGLVDLEFMAQYLQIIHAGERTDLMQAAPRDVFAVASDADWLDPGDAKSLADDYDFLRRLETDVRLILESRQTCFPADPERLEALVHAPGREPLSGDSLRAEFEQRTQRVRACFARILS